MPALTPVGPKALSTQQERRIRNYLDDAFLETSRDFKKRSEVSSKLPTLSSYLSCTRRLLSLILQIPPTAPSGSLRTAYLLRLTNDALTSIVGYRPEPNVLPELLEWLDDIDRAWGVVLNAHVWHPEREVEDKDDNEEWRRAEAKKAVTQTDRTRLRSLLVGGEDRLEEWLSKMDVGEQDDLQTVLERMGVQQGFDELFAGTMAEIGGLDGLMVANDSRGIISCD